MVIVEEHQPGLYHFIAFYIVKVFLYKIMHCILWKSADLVDTAEGADIDSLAAHDTCRADSGGILTWSTAHTPTIEPVSEPGKRRYQILTVIRLIASSQSSL